MAAIVKQLLAVYEYSRTSKNEQVGPKAVKQEMGVAERVLNACNQ